MSSMGKSAVQDVLSLKDKHTPLIRSKVSHALYNDIHLLLLDIYDCLFE